MHWVRRISIALFSILLGLFVISSVYQEYLWKQRSPLERSEEARWVATSNSWFDRDICDWFGACGIAHVNEAGWYSHRRSNKQHDGVRPGDHNFTDFWKSGRSRPEDWSKEERIPREIPRLILDHAPLVHLHSEEVFWPGDIAEHLLHTTPYLNFTPIGSHCRQLNLTSLNELNEYGRFTYTQSDDNVEDRPKWMTGDRNVPVELDNERVGGYDHALLPKAKRGGRSNAPTILVVIDKGDGIVDAFWLFFYSFNQGNKVLNIRFGNHLGDWEHTMIRFQHGEATAVFFSEHAFGAAYTYEAVEKIGKRVSFSRLGSELMLILFRSRSNTLVSARMQCTPRLVSTNIFCL